MKRFPVSFCLLMIPVLFPEPSAQAQQALKIEADASGEKISVYRAGVTDPLLTQNARPDFRPYLHPITTPDGKGELTQFSPGHHKHQTGLYWGLTRVNGRDYFHHPGDGYWKRISARVGKSEGEQVTWTTVYDMIGKDSNPVLRETQKWTMRSADTSHVILDLEFVVLHRSFLSHFPILAEIDRTASFSVKSPGRSRPNPPNNLHFSFRS